MSVWFQTILHGNLAVAQATLDQIPAADLEEDRGAFFAFYVAYLQRDPNAAISRLSAMPRDWIKDNWYHGPKGRLIGDALQMGGRHEAAKAIWQEALKAVETRLAAEPTDQTLLVNRVILLADLGNREEVQRQFSLLLQMIGYDPAGDARLPGWVARVYVALGQKTEAIRIIRNGLKDKRHAVDCTAAELRLDPSWDALRDDPAFAQLIAEAQAVEKSAANATIH
jgi:hypothetical protein